MAVQTIIRNTVNLEEPVVKKILRDMLGSQDEQAHRFEVEVKRGSEAVDLAGASVNGYFIRAGGETVMLTGGVEDGKAYVVLSDSCYRVPGHFSFAMKIQMGDVRHTVLWYEGNVGQTSSDSFVDPENIVPSLEELLAQIEAAEQAAVRANEAADSAYHFANLTVEAVTLANDADATASYVNGVLTIGLPKGPKGDTGSASPITVNGIEAIDSDITLTAADIGAMPDTYEAPVASINEKTGAVVLTAEDVGALPNTYEAPVTSVNGQTGDVTIGGFVCKTLWTNASPTSTFANQTLNLNMSGYAMLLVLVRRSASLGITGYCPLLVGDGETRALTVVGNSLSYRYATVGTDSIVFGEGRWYSSYAGSGGSTTDNGNIIPLVIYGVMGGVE